MAYDINPANFEGDSLSNEWATIFNSLAETHSILLLKVHPDFVSIFTEGTYAILIRRVPQNRGELNEWRELARRQQRRLQMLCNVSGQLRLDRQHTEAVVEFVAACCRQTPLDRQDVAAERAFEARVHRMLTQFPEK
jgi:hypothetical protein